MDTRQMIGNILAAYDAATAAEHARGRLWYVRMQRVAGGHADRLGLDMYSVAGVYAAWSINNGWRNNLRQAGRQIRGRQAYGLGQSLTKAADCMRGQALRVNDKDARKVLAFCANMAGDMTRVTVDRWALRVAYGLTAGGYVPKGSEYDCIESAYVQAAAARGVQPAEMQAVTWIALRHRQGKGKVK